MKLFPSHVAIDQPVELMLNLRVTVIEVREDWIISPNTHMHLIQLDHRTIPGFSLFTDMIDKTFAVFNLSEFTEGHIQALVKLGIRIDQPYLMIADTFYPIHHNQSLTAHEILDMVNNLISQI